jgi:TonB family protein
MMRLSRAHAMIAAAALLGCGKQPEPVSAPPTSASAPATTASAIAEPAPSAVASTSATAVASAAPSTSVAPPPSASGDLAAIVPTSMATGVSGELHVGVAAYGGPPPPTWSDGPTVKGPKSVTNVVSVVGGDAETQKVVKRQQFRFKNCHAKSLAQDPTSEGRIVVTVKVDAQGAVTGATVVSSTAPAHLAACVSAAAKQMKFPVSGADESVVVTLTFKPSS